MTPVTCGYLIIIAALKARKVKLKQADSQLRNQIAELQQNLSRATAAALKKEEKTYQLERGLPPTIQPGWQDPDVM